jgi:hypothetical protein
VTELPPSQRAYGIDDHFSDIREADAVKAEVNAFVTARAALLLLTAEEMLN